MVVVVVAMVVAMTMTSGMVVAVLVVTTTVISVLMTVVMLGVRIKQRGMHPSLERYRGLPRRLGILDCKPHQLGREPHILDMAEIVPP